MMQALARVSTPRSLRESNRKQAVIPAGSTVLEPVGTAPGLVVPRGTARPDRRWCVLPGPPRELQPMWDDGDRDGYVRGRDRRRTTVPPRDHAHVRDSRVGDRLDAACRERGGPRRSTRSRSRPACAAARSRSPPASSRRRRRVRRAAGVHRASATPTRCSRADGSTVDEQVVELLDGRLVGRRRVVHRRADVGAPDRAGGLLGLLRPAASWRTPTRRSRRSPASTPELIGRTAPCPPRSPRRSRSAR